MSTLNKQKDRLFYFVMVFPTVFLFLLVIAYPIVRSFALGLTEYNAFQPDKTLFVGLKNYIRIFSDPLFWRAFKNNMFVVAVSVLGQIPIAIILAYLLHRRAVRFQSFFQAMVFLPNVISVIVVGLMWRWIVVDPKGVVSAFLKIVSHDPSKTFDIALKEGTAMFPIGFALIWIYTGFYMLIFLANLQKIDNQVFEAAMVDGASESLIFRKIVLPALSGTIVVNAVLAIAGSLKGFDLIWAMTSGGPADYTIVLPIYMYKYAFQSHNIDAYSYGSAISIVIVFISICLILLTRFIEKKLKKGER